MQERSLWRRVVASYVSPHAFAPHTRAALEGAGYRIVPAATRGRFDDDSWEPDVRIVDERHLDRLPAEPYLPRTPVIVLTGPRPRQCSDRRVVAQIARPAGLDALYPALQEALEDTPRRSVRTSVRLPARCTRSDRRWVGAIVSLSKGGCFLNTSADLDAGLDLNLVFPLPVERMISTRARVLHRFADGARLEFTKTPPETEAIVSSYVHSQLATR